jgi:hypothetical protein
MKNIIAILSLMGLMVSASPSMAQGSGNGNNGISQAGGLPALAAEVAELKALIESLQAQVGDNDDPYAGIYSVTMVENGIFGCGATTDPASVFGTSGTLGYFQDQAISSYSTRSAVFTATSDGLSLSIPDYYFLTQELRLSGFYEEGSRIEGDISATIAADGSLLFDPGPESEFFGQMAADGSAFTILARGHFIEGYCDDAYTVMLTGIRK